MAVYDNLQFPKHADRPFVAINMVLSADGKAVAPDDKHPLFGGEHDRANMLALRASCDALLYGATTGKDVPPEEFLDAEFQAARKRNSHDPRMKFVLLSHGGHLSDSDKLFSNPDFTPIVYVPESAKISLKNAEVRHAGKTALDLPKILEELKRDGVNTALCEGGPTTNEPFFRHRLVDEYFLTVKPVIYGGKPTLSAVEGTLLPPELGKLELVSAQPEGDEVFLRYKVRR